MANVKQESESDLGKHGIARRLADEAARLDAAGDADGAERVLRQAMHTDPDAVAASLAEGSGAFARDATDPETDDPDVRAASRTLDGPDRAPSRAGISGPGSGADSERR